jgi:hypothetical protein
MPHEIIFKSTDRSGLYSELFMTINGYNEIFIEVFYQNKDDYEGMAIMLEKESAIKLAKELRKMISFLED